MLRRLRSLSRAIKSRRDFEQGMNEELQFHIGQYTDELVRSGVPREEAARKARIEFGSLDSVEEECREARGLLLFDEAARQLRHAARLLSKTPKFTATALVTLAVCIGANLTIFAVVDAILLRPLPFPDSGRLVTIYNTYPKAGVDRDGSSTANYYERRGTIPAFAGVAIYAYGTAVVGETGATEREQTVRVSPDFFATLGTGPAMGSSFTDDETSLQTDKVVILTDAYWRKYFAADPNVIGKHLRVDGISNTVAGVLPPGYRFLSSEARLYFPFSSNEADRSSSERHSGGNAKFMIARLRPGATLEQAQAQIDAQNRALEVDDPQAKMIAAAGFRSVVVPLHADHVRSIRPVLLWTQAGALALLLIGAVNLTNLLLIRASGRGKEIALRRALGASRWHIVSEALVETTLLTLAGGLLGLAAGAVGVSLLSVLAVDRLPLGSQVAMDSHLALIAVLGSAAMGLVLAVPVAWFNLRGNLNSAIQSEARGGTPNHAAQSLRHAFIVAQIALATILLSGAGMLGVSLEHAMSVSPGFRPDHVLSGQISVAFPSWEAALAFNRTLLTGLAHQPGVVAAGMVNNLPLSGDNGKSSATVEGHVRQPGESPRGNYAYGVDGDYFMAMGFRLVQGRFLNADDSRRPGRRCVVDEDFARYYWPHTSAIGQHLFMGPEAGPESEAYTVVGVVGAVKQAGLTEQTAQGAIYYPWAMRTDPHLSVVIRSSLPPESLGPTLAKLVRQTDPELAVNDIRPMDARIADSLVTQRSPALLAGIFSAIAVLLVAVGIYGILSYAVAQRRREIGVRMALGASPGQIRSQFLTVALRLLVSGAILGGIGSLLIGPAMRTLLFEVPPLDLAILAGTMGIIGAVSLAACLVPSHLATRISPVDALADL